MNMIIWIYVSALTKKKIYVSGKCTTFSLTLFMRSFFSKLKLVHDEHLSKWVVYYSIKLTLVFYNVIPLVSNALGGFFRWFGGENDQALILLGHVIHGWPIFTILGHSRQREQVIAQPRSIEHLGEPLGRCHVVFNEDGHNFWWICFQKWLDVFKYIYSRLLCHGGCERKSEHIGLEYLVTN